MKFTLLPYTERDGIRTVPDSEIRKLFDRTEKDGLADIVFCEGTIQTPEEFLQMAKYSDCLFWVLLDGTETVGYTWLNRFENRSAQQHFCVFKEYWGKAIDLGKYVLHEIMHIKDKQDRFIFDLLTGFVPAWNKKAINFSLKCGGQTHGEIPNAIWNQVKQQSESAVFIYYTRGQ